jgi:hypothetical protein
MKDDSNQGDPRGRRKRVYVVCAVIFAILLIIVTVLSIDSGFV